MVLSVITEKSKGLLEQGFNKKKLLPLLSQFNTPDMAALQKVAKASCFGQNEWPQLNQIKAWMLSAETATFMKWGGLGMVASGLPENFNKVFNSDAHEISIVTPMYEGNTGKKSAKLEGNCYIGAENKQIEVEQLKTLDVVFTDFEGHLKTYPVEVYLGEFNDVKYIFLRNNRFFSITPSPKNPSKQDGCYVLNNHNINEVERFAFFSKAIWILLCKTIAGKMNTIKAPNILLANDWHSGAIGGLCKYLTPLIAEKNITFAETACKIAEMPIIHIVHHLGYQGWDYPNTARILNALYEENTTEVLKNARATKNSNPRAKNALMVYDCYNQVSSNFHLADRIIAVSKNYMEEVSKDLCFGYDFRDVLKIRKDHRTFFGILNGYEKKKFLPMKVKFVI